MSFMRKAGAWAGLLGRHKTRAMQEHGPVCLDGTRHGQMLEIHGHGRVCLDGTRHGQMLEIHGQSTGGSVGAAQDSGRCSGC